MPAILCAEHEFLIAACLEKPIDLPLAAGGQRPIDWHRLHELAAEHRVEGLLWQRLTAEKHLAAPAATMAALEQTARAGLFDYLAKLAETSRICALLAGAGVDVIVLKGCAVGQRFFSPTAGLRFSNDIDLLVAPAAHETAGRILVENGFERTLPDPDLPPAAEQLTRYFGRTFNYRHRVSGIVVELHHQLSTDPDTLAVPFDALFERSIRVTADGADFRGLSDADCFLYLCNHGARHAYERLKWLADTARAARHFTQDQLDELQAASDAAGCRAHVDISLRLLHELGFPGLAPRPRDVGRTRGLVELVRGRIAAGVVPTRITLKLLPEYGRRLRYELSLRQSARSKLMLLQEFLVYVPDSRLVRLGEGWLWVYVLVRWPSAILRYLMRTLFPSREIVRQ